ncbi:Phage tail tape measure protein [Sphingomonas aurantiaca]|uniref:Phage tail tape measure protein n=1 Tax=Sphingomonas aurantiaca TaxID=185949 RepID=A0A5E7ZSB2_9SPHN|nr:phage tail tape measure protein [Sphingomonas aurantiaca]VVT20278.1 Phage tail tape measure protein [Sphingomonas aurantiaca]
MSSAVVGAARVVFGADTSEFDSKAKGVEGVLGKLVEAFEAVETRLKRVGAGVTLGITVPFLAMVKTIDKGAGTFEGQMKRVEAALDNVTGKQLKELSDQARNLGPAVGKGATEAASGIEELGLAGLSTSEILGGGLKATLDLATAGMVDVAPAAGLVTDVLGQFKKTAADLPAIVSQTVGAMDASKFGFQDFADATSQGGGVAASAGVSFTDFATAIAATSAQFSSGSDAGTSFKTYIQSLVGNSDEAKFAMKKLGIEFFDAQGKMKPVSEQAQILRDKLGDLSDVSKTDALKTIFGSDAARTAIGLMEQGRVGFEKFAATVSGGDVEAKIAKRMEGSAAAGERISHAWESVKIALGDTGILDVMTNIKNMFATMLEGIAHAPPAVLKVGAAFAAFSAALGPLALILGHIGAFLLAKFVSGFGMVGRVLALIISPVSTIIGMLGEAGLVRVLTMLAGRFLAFLGPVGLAISAFLLFKDKILIVMGQVWDKLVSTLGPPLEAIMSKVGGIFAALSSGPVGSAFSFLIGVITGLADVIGTVLGGVLGMFGELLVRVLDAGAQAISGFLDVVRGFVDLISALLSGDFAGAWEAAGSMIEAVFGTIVDMAVALVPDIEAPLRLVYEAAKAWLSDGFGSVLTWMSGAVQTAVDYVATVFPNVVSAAKGVYEGVKGWLVDKFGGLLTWISGAAKYIGDKFKALKNTLGFGGGPEAANDNPAPPKLAPTPDVPRPKRTVDFEKPGKDKKSHEKKGRDTKYDAENREQLRAQIDLEAARLRGDREAEQILQDKLDLSKQIEAYQRTGLTLDQARISAARDMKDLAAARAAQSAKAIADERAEVALDIAHLDQNAGLEESLSRQAELKKRIASYYAQTNNLAEATKLAEADQASTDAARARVRARWFEDDAADRAVRLAQLRGDSDEEIRQAQRLIDIRKRARELEAQLVDPATAQAQATMEIDEEDKARLTGVWRSTFKDGVQAALDGDLKSFAKDWFKNRIAKGMEEALNSLADLIASLFSKTGSSGSSGGGLLGALGTAIGGLLGKGGAGTVGPVDMTGWDAGGPMSAVDTGLKLPGFKTGGSFKVGGMSGIDRNIVAFRGTVGEHVNITKGNDNGPIGTTVVHMPITYSGAVDIADKAYVQANAQQTKSQVMSAVTEANRRRAGGK